MIAAVYLGISISKAATLLLRMYQYGIDAWSKNGFHGIDFKASNGARIIALFTFLWPHGVRGPGPPLGMHIDGVFIVDKVVDNLAKWKSVPESKDLYHPTFNRCH